MNEDQQARFWADHAQDVNAGIDRMIAGLMQAFRVLHRIEWSAPWKND